MEFEFDIQASHNTNVMPCPFCSGEVATDAIKCKHCGELVSKWRRLHGNKIPERKEAKPLPLPIPEKKEIKPPPLPFHPKSSNFVIEQEYPWPFIATLIVGALCLHILFCAESPLFYISPKYPIKSLFGCSAYGIAQAFLFIAFLTPIVTSARRYNKGSGFLKYYNYKAIIIALYIGVIIKLVLFFDEHGFSLLPL